MNNADEGLIPPTFNYNNHFDKSPNFNFGFFMANRQIFWPPIIPVIWYAVNATIATIQENYLELGGEHLNNTLENLSNPLIYEGHEITKSPMDEQECFSSIRWFAEKVVQNIKERFLDLVCVPSMNHNLILPSQLCCVALKLRKYRHWLTISVKLKVVSGLSYKEL